MAPDSFDNLGFQEKKEPRKSEMDRKLEELMRENEELKRRNAASEEKK